MRSLEDIVAIILVMILAFFVIGTCTARADEIPESVALHAIMGEARGEPYEGKLALAEAIRNRVSNMGVKRALRGVYGLRVPKSRLLQEEASVWQESAKAWHESIGGSSVGGADHWFSQEDLELLNKTRPAWYRRLIFVRKIGDHSFYKRRA